MPFKTNGILSSCLILVARDNASSPSTARIFSFQVVPIRPGLNGRLCGVPSLYGQNVEWRAIIDEERKAIFLLPGPNDIANTPCHVRNCYPLYMDELVASLKPQANNRLEGHVPVNLRLYHTSRGGFENHSQQLLVDSFKSLAISL